MNTKFNSQICTTREQSERLLSLGLKKETADCYLFEQDGETSIVAKPYSEIEKQLEGLPHDCAIYPAWSLGRLLEVMRMKASSQIVPLDDTFDRLIEGIETRIKEGCFNEEYLV